jgi:hypothetical protein
VSESRPDAQDSASPTHTPNAQDTVKATLTPPRTPANTGDFAAFCRSLGLPSGVSLNLDPWQRRFLDDALDDDLGPRLGVPHYSHQRDIARAYAAVIICGGAPSTIACATEEEASRLLNLIHEELRALGRTLGIDAEPLLNDLVQPFFPQSTPPATEQEEEGPTGR